MSITALFPVWLAALLIYLSSNRQTLISNPINRHIALISGLVLCLLAGVLFSLHFPVLSSALAVTVVFMLSLVSVTIVTAYSNKRVILLTALLGCISLFAGGYHYVA